MKMYKGYRADDFYLVFNEDYYIYYSEYGKNRVSIRRGQPRFYGGKIEEINLLEYFFKFNSLHEYHPKKINFRIMYNFFVKDFIKKKNNFKPLLEVISFLESIMEVPEEERMTLEKRKRILEEIKKGEVA